MHSPTSSLLVFLSEATLCLGTLGSAELITEIQEMLEGSGVLYSQVGYGIWFRAGYDTRSPGFFMFGP